MQAKLGKAGCAEGEGSWPGKEISLSPKLERACPCSLAAGRDDRRELTGGKTFRAHDPARGPHGELGFKPRGEIFQVLGLKDHFASLPWMGEGRSSFPWLRAGCRLVFHQNRELSRIRGLDRPSFLQMSLPPHEVLRPSFKS